MRKKQTSVLVRPKRQITLPNDICERLGIGPGDILEISVEDRVLIARPRKTLALEALDEIQRAFERSGISEEELQEAGRQVRQDIARERYGAEN